jgi:hypothetical protein
MGKSGGLRVNLPHYPVTLWSRDFASWGICGSVWTHFCLLQLGECNGVKWVEAKSLFNILQRTGQLPTTRNNVTQDANSVKVENPSSKKSTQCFKMFLHCLFHFSLLLLIANYHWTCSKKRYFPQSCHMDWLKMDLLVFLKMMSVGHSHVCGEVFSENLPIVSVVA